MSNIYDRKILEAKAKNYCDRTDTLIAQMLGCGTQGIVFQTERNSAIKVHDQINGYQRERDAYKRLKDRNIESIRGLMIPRIENWEDALLIFEMSIVHIPCIVDFGGAYLDNAPDHMVRDEIWHQEKSEEFGDNWAEAQAVIRELEFSADIWLADVNSGNIRFAD